MDEISYKTVEFKQIRSLACGDKLSIPIIRYQGTDKEASSVYMQAGAHGAEVLGNGVLYSLEDYFDRNRPLGDITLVPFCNPYGTNLKSGEFTAGRFDPTTGKNYNRYYPAVSNGLLKNNQLPSKIENFLNQDDVLGAKKLVRQLVSEYLIEYRKGALDYVDKLNCELFALAFEHDIAIDLHTASHSCEHLYCARSFFESSKRFNIPYIIETEPTDGGALEDAFVFPWIKIAKSIVSELYKRLVESIEGFTLELGGHEEFSFEKTQDQADRILNYLGYKKVIESKLEKEKLENYYYCAPEDYQSLIAPVGGLYDLKCPIGELLEQGTAYTEVLSIDKNRPGGQLLQKKKLNLEQEGVLISVLSSSIVHEGIEWARMMTNIKQL
jgi:predicted deacylase